MVVMGARYGATPGLHAARSAPRTANLGRSVAGSRGKMADFRGRKFSFALGKFFRG
jgi:hypothetical protein